MIARRIRQASLLIALLAAAATAVAGSTLALSLERMLERSEIRVYGDVVAVETETGDDDAIRTRVEISVVRDLRTDGEEDEEAPESVVLRFSGGELDDGSTAVVDDVPRLQEGDRVLALAYRDDALASPIVGVWQGLWRVGADGLVDRLGRVLGLDDGVVRPGGADRDVDAVLDALASGAELGEAPLAAESSPPASPAADVGPGAAGEQADEPAGAVDAAGAEEAGRADGAEDTDDAAEIDEADAGRDADRAASDDEAASGDVGTDDVGPDEVGPDEVRPDEVGPDEVGPDDAAAERIEVRLDVPEDEALRTALQRAAAAWRDAGAPLEVAFDDDADDRVRIGPADLFGPDALAFTRRVPDRAGVEVLLRPGNEGRRVDVLARELGLLAGLPPGDGPLRSGALPADDEVRPTAADADELLASRDRTPEDLNGDGVVDLYDLALLAEAYGRTGTRLAADLDGSGRVDDADIERLRTAYEFLPASRDAPADRRRPDDP